MPGIRADRKLWLTADKARVVEDGHPDAAFLLATPGYTIPIDEAARLGLEERAGRVHFPTPYVAKAVQGPAEDKAVKGPTEDKRAKRAAKTATPDDAAAADGTEGREG